jgi:hypothetical protein
MPSKEIDQLYRVFSRYPRPASLHGCPCCTDDETSKALIRDRLRDLPASVLSHYAFKALSTWGTLEDYRYFLPRILELTSTGELDCDTEVTLGKLGYADWTLWPDDEQTAVRQFVSSLWCESIRSGQDWQADAILCGIARSMSDISSLLALADSIDPSFRIVYRDEHSRADKRKLTNSFWERSLPSYEQALTWVYA